MYWKKYNESDFDIDTFRHLVFQRQLHLKVTFCSVNPWKWHFLQFSCFFSERMFWIQNVFKCQILKRKKIQRVGFWKKRNKASGFRFKISQRLWCGIEKSQTSYFELNFFRHNGFKKNLHTKDHVLCFFSANFVSFVVFFKNHGFDLKIWRMSVSERKRKKRVRFCVESLTTRQIWNWKKL